MNYLAHAYLSGSNEELLVGNFIADGIRGNKIAHLPKNIQQGVLLHRKIDVFTDEHPLNEAARKLLHPLAGKYAGVVLDMFYDYLLAKSWTAYYHETLLNYTNWCYLVLEKHKQWLPERTSYMLPHMINGNWLYNYREKEGIMKSLGGMTQRLKTGFDLMPGGKLAFELEEELLVYFKSFFEELITHVAIENKNMMTN